MSYHTFKDENGNDFGSFQVFYDIKYLTFWGQEVDAGFYWWPCFPGCLPDTDDDPTGPFSTYELAYQDAQEFAKGGN